MQIAQLRYFVEICRQENVTRAAEYLHIAQPSLSIAIRNLEEELGIELFYRRKGRLQLTREGKTFLSKAMDIIGRFDALDADMRELRSQKKRLKIGVSMFSAYVYRTLFSDFMKTYPDIAPELCEYSANEVEELLLNDKLDIGICMLTERTGDQFHFAELQRPRVGACVRSDHPLAGRERISVEDLRGQPLVMARDDSFHTTAMIMERFRQANIIPRILLKTGQLVTSIRYVLEQGAVSFDTDIFVKGVPGLAWIPLDPPLAMPIGMIWRRGHYLGSSASLFAEFVSKYQKEASAREHTLLLPRAE